MSKWWGWVWLAGALLSALVSGTAIAQFAGKPITIVVPFTAGGGTDITARLLATSMARHAGTKVVVVNRPGAGGEIGMASVADSPADGYTLAILNTPNALTIPIERNARFSLGSFELLANVIDDPGTLSVHADSPIKTIQQLVDAARKAPESLTYGTAGIGSAGHISMLLFERAAGVKLRHIPFKGTSDVRTALLGRQIDVATANLGEALTFARGQPWRTLGQMTLRRSAMATDLATFAEAGYAVEGGSLRGLGAPKGLPPERLHALVQLVDQTIGDPEFLAAARKADQEVRYLRRDEYRRVLNQMEIQLRSLWATSPWNE